MKWEKFEEVVKVLLFILEGSRYEASCDLSCLKGWLKSLCCFMVLFFTFEGLV